MERSPSDWSLNDGQDEVLYGIALNEAQAREMVDGIQSQLHTVTLEETEAQVRHQDTAGPLPPPFPPHSPERVAEFQVEEARQAQHIRREMLEMEQMYNP